MKDLSGIFARDLAAPRRHDASRHLNIVHCIYHPRVRSDQFLEQSSSTFICLILQVAHHRSGVGVCGRIVIVAEVTAGAIADKICVVGGCTVRDGPCASSKNVVQALGNFLQCVRNGVACRRWSCAEDFVVYHEIVCWPGVSLYRRVRLCALVSVIVGNGKYCDG